MESGKELKKVDNGKILTLNKVKKTKNKTKQNKQQQQQPFYKIQKG